MTDGITEARGEGGEHYGQERMDRLLSATRHGAPEQLIRGLMADLRGFTNGVEPSDDLTVLAVRVRSVPGQRADLAKLSRH